MPGLWQIGLGIFILMMMPSIIPVIEGRRFPPLAPVAVAVGALLYQAASAGWHGVLGALVSGLASASLLAAGVAFTQRRSGHRLFGGGEIRLLSASAMWLSPFLAAAALLTGAVVTVGWIAARRALGLTVGRPLLPLFTITPLLFAAFGHY